VGQRDLGERVGLVLTARTAAFWGRRVLVVRALRRDRLEAPRDARRRDALTILRERLTRGELTVEEYERRRRHLVDGR
jgi:putative membrane protein